MVLIETLLSLSVTLAATLGFLKWADEFDHAVSKEYRAISERKWTCQKTP